MSRNCNPGSEMYYNMVWEGMVEMGHNPKIKPIFLAIFAGYMGRCSHCGMGAVAGERTYQGQQVFGTAFDNECPKEKE